MNTSQRTSSGCRRRPRCPHLKAQARQSTLGLTIDQAMAAIERDNPALKDVLPKDRARPALGQAASWPVDRHDRQHSRRDVEAVPEPCPAASTSTFLSQFASAERKKAASSYTPRCVGKLLVEMLVSNTFGCLLERQVANDLVGRTLVALRDALLPKLASGEIRVRDARGRRSDRMTGTLLTGPEPVNDNGTLYGIN